MALIIREPDTGAVFTAAMLEALASKLNASKCIDAEGIEFAVHTLELTDAISIIEQLIPLVAAE